MLILLPVAMLLLGLTAIVNPSQAREILKSAIRSANAKSKSGKKWFVEYAAR